MLQTRKNCQNVRHLNTVICNMNYIVLVSFEDRNTLKKHLKLPDLKVYLHRGQRCSS